MNFKSLQWGSNTSLLIKVGTIIINTFLPMRNKFVYSYSIKIMLQDLTNFWKAFSASWWLLKDFPCQKLSQMLEVVVGWQAVKWIWWMRQNFIAQFVQLLKHWLRDMQSGVVMQNWGLSVDQGWLQTLQFSVHLIDLLSVFLRCNRFAGIQKAVVDQTGSRPPVTMVFFWCKFGFFRASSRSNHRAGYHQLSYKIHFSLHVTIRLRNSLLLLCTVREDNTSK